MIGVIGGSGLYDIEGFEVEEEIFPETPFGYPSDTIKVGVLSGKKVAFLPRHGVGHFISPSEVNYRANIYALKMLGCSRVLSVSAVGSMREEIKPGDFVVPDQFIDFTKLRKNSFFEGGIVVHVSMADPVCPEMVEALCRSCGDLGFSFHKGGTYICIEGPQFSTRAESNFYRSMGVSIIGMTNMPEAKLAREAELCYATLALSTDYDCWREGFVTVDEVVKVMREGMERAKRVLVRFLELVPGERSCPCKDALKNAVITSPEAIPREVRDRLSLLLEKVLP